MSLQDRSLCHQDRNAFALLRAPSTELGNALLSSGKITSYPDQRCSSRGRDYFRNKQENVLHLSFLILRGDVLFPSPTLFFPPDILSLVRHIYMCWLHMTSVVDMFHALIRVSTVNGHKCTHSAHSTYGGYKRRTWQTLPLRIDVTPQYL